MTKPIPTTTAVEMALLKREIEIIRTNELEHLKADFKELDKKNDDAHMHFSAELEKLGSKVEDVKDQLQIFLAKVGITIGIGIIIVQIIITYLKH